MKERSHLVNDRISLIPKKCLYFSYSEENKMKKKVKAEWHPKDNKHSRTNDDWKRIMAEPYVLETEKEEKKEKKNG